MFLWVLYADYLKYSNVSMKSHWGGTTNAVVLVMEREQEELETIRSFLNVWGLSCQRAAVAGSAVKSSLELLH